MTKRKIDNQLRLIKSASQNLGCTLSGTGCTAIFRSKAEENEGFRELCSRKPRSQNYRDVGFGTHSKVLPYKRGHEE